MQIWFPSQQRWRLSLWCGVFEKRNRGFLISDRHFMHRDDHIRISDTHLLHRKSPGEENLEANVSLAATPSDELPEAHEGHDDNHSVAHSLPRQLVALYHFSFSRSYHGGRLTNISQMAPRAQHVHSNPLLSRPISLCFSQPTVQVGDHQVPQTSI